MSKVNNLYVGAAGAVFGAAAAIASVYLLSSKPSSTLENSETSAAEEDSVMLASTDSIADATGIPELPRSSRGAGSSVGGGVGTGGEDDDDDEDEDEEVEDDGKDYKMVLVVRQDLGMQKGKIVAQTGHAVLAVFEEAQIRSDLTRDWIDQWEVKGTKKIALKIKGEEALMALQALAESNDVPNAVIEDAGLTQVDPGSRTVLGLGPAPSEILDQITGKLPLL